MLNFLFGINGKVVRFVEMAGIFGFVAILFAGIANKIIFGLYLLSYLLIRLCASYNWYRHLGVDSDNKGIRAHFKKMLVAASYIIALTNGLILLHVNFVVYFSLALLALLLHVNIILVYLHLQDRDKTPPNYFSG